MCLTTTSCQQPVAIRQLKCSASQTVHRLSTKPSKRVSFNESVDVHLVCERSSEMTLQDKIQAYYSKDELKCFESELKVVRSKVIQQARALSKFSPAFTPAEHLSFILESDASLRGFGVIMCPTRRRIKSVAMSSVHDYQKKLRSDASLLPQHIEVIIAEAYSQLSHWSKTQALQRGRNDQIRAYPGTVLSCQHVSPVNVSPVSDTKRRVSEVEEQRKRCRLS